MKEVLVDIWKDINGFNGKYQVSYSGQVRRVFKSGKTKILAQFKKAGKAKKIYRDRLFVHLIDDKGKDHTIMVHQIVALHFLGQPKPGQVPYHINLCVTDNWASNLGYIDRQRLGKLTGAARRRQTVLKINSCGEIVDFYSSAREAGRKNYMSYQTIMDRCNGKCKKAYAPDGLEYAWEDKQRSVDQALRRIELVKKNEFYDDMEMLKRPEDERNIYAYDF